MDTVTHIALGACIGEAVLAKKLGSKAMFLGAIAQSVPDIDFLSVLWTKMPQSLLAHRGFTHSILFCLMAMLFLGWLSWKWRRARDVPYWQWVSFWGIQLFVHIFLDAFNNYGVGWFEPFSHYRLSFQAIFVADPFFSIWHGVAFAMLVILRASSPNRKFWWKFGIIMSTVYLCYCIVNKIIVDNAIEKVLKKQGIAYNRYMTTPAPLNNWLWFVAAETDSGYHVGYRSVFDGSDPKRMSFFPRYPAHVTLPADAEDISLLKRFSQGYYTVEQWNDTLVFNDLRFGQVIGWYNPKERFAFHFYLGHDNNELVVQRGRFAKWNRKTLRALFRRIKGE